jgi:hypothetical protein
VGGAELHDLHCPEAIIYGIKPASLNGGRGRSAQEKSKPFGAPSLDFSNSGDLWQTGVLEIETFPALESRL